MQLLYHRNHYTLYCTYTHAPFTHTQATHRYLQYYTEPGRSGSLCVKHNGMVFEIIVPPGCGMLASKARAEPQVTPHCAQPISTRLTHRRQEILEQYEHAHGANGLSFSMVTEVCGDRGLWAGREGKGKWGGGWGGGGACTCYSAHMHVHVHVCSHVCSYAHSQCSTLDVRSHSAPCPPE